MNKKFFSGDSVRQALLQAARHFQVEPEEVAYREVDRRHGFLRSRRRAVIEVDTENPLRGTTAGPNAESPAESTVEPPAEPPNVQAEEAEEAVEAREAAMEGDSPIDASEDLPVQDLRTDEIVADVFGDDMESVEPNEPEPAPAETESPDVEPPAKEGRQASEASADVSDATRQALGRIFELGRLDLEIKSVRQGEEKLEVELRGQDEELLLEDRGRLLLALQHLLPRMLRGLTGTSAPCRVDCDDFHEIRTEQLRDLAQRVASEVRNRRRSRTLEPMSPDERRIVHLTLADDPAVETVSQGNGLFKRVQIRPQKMQPRGFDPFGRE